MDFSLPREHECRARFRLLQRCKPALKHGVQEVDSGGVRYAVLGHRDGDHLRRTVYVPPSQGRRFVPAQPGLAANRAKSREPALVVHLHRSVESPPRYRGPALSIGMKHPYHGSTLRAPSLPPLAYAGPLKPLGSPCGPLFSRAMNRASIDLSWANLPRVRR